jgi:hypothetical protein
MKGELVGIAFGCALLIAFYAGVYIYREVQFQREMRRRVATLRDEMQTKKDALWHEIELLLQQETT